MPHRIAAFLLGLIVCAPSVAVAQLATFETVGLRLVYIDPTETFLVPHAARTFLNSLAFQKRLFGFEPSGEITLLLADFSDTGNAGASVVPRNTLTVQIAPLNFAFETIAGNERMNIIMNHELVHVATMDQAAGADRLFRKLFGGKVMPVHEQPESILYFLWTTPRVAAPRWYHEGIAVFVDTWMAGGLGRAQSGYDEMVFRSMVRDGTPFYDPLGLVSEGTKVDFQLQINSYLYGTRFMTWLARRYSPEKLVEWVSRREGSRAYYTTQFRHVFGRSLQDAWAEWARDEREFQLRNLETIHSRPLTPHRDITSRALGSVSRAFYDSKRGRIFAAFNYPGVVAHIGSIDVEDGRIEKLTDIKGPVIYTVTSLAYDRAGGTLFYTTDNGALRDVMRLDVTTRKTEMLLKDARIGDLALNPADQSLWGVRHLNGICTLVRIPPPYREWYQVISWPYGTVMYDLDVSPDGSKLVASFGEISGHQEVRVFTLDSLAAKDTTPIAKFDFGTAVPNSFVFAADGRSVYGSSYFTGVSNIFQYDLERQKLDAVSNTDTGFFRPVPMDDGSLVVFRYSGEGFVPARIQPRPLDDVGSITFLGERLIAEHPVLKDWMVGSPARVPLDTMPQRTGAYRLAGGLRRESFYPVIQGYKDVAAVGMRFNFSDPLQLNRASATLSYSPAGDLPSSERVHFKAEYQRYDWRGRFEWNGADFYDLFGPTKTGRKGYLLGAGRKTTLIFDEPRRLDWDIEGRLAGNLDTLPEYQNVAVDIDRLLTVESTLSYTDIRNSLGNVDDETGYRWSMGLEGQYVESTVFPKVYATYDRGLPLPAGHSSLWFRGAAGFSPRSAGDTFANFYFGGFGNNWVDHREEKRYRDIESFPGAELNEIAGRNFLKGTIEINLPPWRFRRAGTPGFHATWARPAIFVGGLATNLDSADRRRVATNVGAQLDFRFGLLSALDMTISAGAAVAFQNDGGTKREAMVSVKILR
ncbi:MAG: hypothetical protein WBC51_13080 [Vicinamibacterales bacterium]